MRTTALLLCFSLAFFAGAFVEHQFARPFGWFGTLFAAASIPGGEDFGLTVVPRYSKARGAEDAPRSDTPQGATNDLAKCINTMVVRRESETDARAVCQKLISGISR